MSANHTTPIPRPKGHVRPSPETSIRLREFVTRWGEPVAVEVFGLNVATVARAAAGFPVLGSVLACIEAGLRMPEDELRAFEHAYGKKTAP